MRAETLYVQTAKTPFAALLFLGIIMVPLGAVLLFNGIKRENNLALLIGFGLISTCAVVVWAFVRSRRRAVRYFSRTGIGRRFGGEISWDQLVSIVDQMVMYRVRSGAKYPEVLWRTELVFKNGTKLWLIPGQIWNFGEVHHFVRNRKEYQGEQRKPYALNI